MTKAKRKAFLELFKIFAIENISRKKTELVFWDDTQDVSDLKQLTKCESCSSRNTISRLCATVWEMGLKK